MGEDGISERLRIWKTEGSPCEGRSRKILTKPFKEIIRGNPFANPWESLGTSWSGEAVSSVFVPTKAKSFFALTVLERAIRLRIRIINVQSCGRYDSASHCEMHSINVGKLISMI